MNNPLAPVDTINGQTPLEDRLLGVHPRLHFTAAKIDALKKVIGQDPWNRLILKVRVQADAGVQPNPALLYLLTGENRYLDISRKGIDDLLNTRWPADIRKDGGDWGHHLYNLALLYDWLYHNLDEETRLRMRNCLEVNGRKHFEALAKYEIYPSSTYGWNIASDYFANVLAAGMAIYGEANDISPWLRFSMERARLITGALGYDGASAEGICYGGFFNEYYIRSLDLICDLQGWDFFAKNEYLKNMPYFYLYSMLPRKWISSSSVHLCFGDGIRANWYGPDTYLRKVAALYRDPYAQWTAAAQDTAGATRNEDAWLNLAWYDPSVPEKGPEALPTLRHFTDKDLVIMRSGWNGDEAVFGFKCGPHAGHHALENYQQSIGGGHMAPDAGSFLLFAHGDWLITDGWYARKMTAYRNTALINGIGQTGEGGEWFECSQLRRERRGPSILTVASDTNTDCLVADIAPAYEPQAGLERYLRHVLYVKPDCWVICDEFAAKQPSDFTLLFHANDQPFLADRPFTRAGNLTWTTGGKHGALRITALAPDDVDGQAEFQQIKGIGAHRDRPMDMLRLTNRQPAKRAFFLTVLEAYPVNRGPAISPSCERLGENMILSLRTKRKTFRFVLSPGQANPATAIFHEIK